MARRLADQSSRARDINFMGELALGFVFGWVAGFAT
jgi:hypothetical protein